MTTMNAISLWQPWASLIDPAWKTRETRSWPAPRTAWGQWIAIHAAKQFKEEEREESLREPFNTALYTLGIRQLSDLPLGAVVALAQLVDCRHVRAYDRGARVVTWTDGRCEVLTAADAAFGDYSPGRWAWNLTAIRRLPTPIPAKGAQGVWRWPVPPTVAALLEAA